eukprot:TRINITY_DN8504_c0_g1_i1.p1 TRINITY_DN8504_c0_g1~~TRINITY_DN8504_c0_g1_i1.p1  ORF type:complete len:633 (-),score=98.22 TRINITY_DN8504_c0_g1_i1:956-2854(-)
MQLSSRGVATVCVILVLIQRFDVCLAANKIASSFYESNGIIGVSVDSTSVNQNFNGFSYAALFSKTSSGYTIDALIHADNDSGFAASVSIGDIYVNSSKYGTNEEVLMMAAVGSTTSQQIYIYDVGVCVSQKDSKNNNTCGTALLTFSSPTKDCVIGSILHFGNGFLVSSCTGNLIMNSILGLKAANKHNISPPLLVFQFYNDATSFTFIEPPPVNFSNICSSSQGQISTTAIDVSGNLVAASVCALCSKIRQQQLTVNHLSMFSVWEMVTEGGSSQLVQRAVQVTQHTLSCPKSIAIYGDFLAIGYPLENSVDFYYFSNITQSYTLATTLSVDDEAPYFGAYIDILENVLVVGVQGDFSTGVQGAVYFYQISSAVLQSVDPFDSYNMNFDVSKQIYYDQPIGLSPLFAKVPSLNYQVDYYFGFQVVLSRNELLVVSQDPTQSMWAFQVFEECPAGSQWDMQTSDCSLCSPGKYKSTPSANSSFSVCQACPSGSYSWMEGITDIEGCTHPPTGNLCPLDSSCADGAVAPLPYIRSSFFLSESNPDLSETDDLDFENTFYTSCYPLGVFVLFATTILALFICIPCPCWNCCSKGRETHRKIVKKLVKISFMNGTKASTKLPPMIFPKMRKLYC